MHRENRRSGLLTFLKIGCRLFGQWSLNPDDPRWERVLLEIWYFIQFMNELYGMVAIIHGSFCCFKSTNESIKPYVDVAFMIEALYNSMYVRWRRKEFRRLATEMEEFFTTTNCVNTNRPNIICRVLTISFTICCMVYGVVPLFSKIQTTPLSTVYFAVPRDVHWGRSLIYAVNMFQVVNAASVLFLDMLMMLIMWHVACKFSILENTFNILNEKKLKLWIKEHQDALNYAKEINSIIVPLALKSMFAVMFDIIISGVVTTRNLNLIELIKFFTVTVFSALRFVACSWVADTMAEKADNIARKIYVSPWIYTSPRTRRMAVIIMQRSQKTVAIRAAGFLSAWTLTFYAKSMHTIITYMMTLRAVIEV